MNIVNVEAFDIQIPHREELRKYPQWIGTGRTWLYKVHTDEGIVGLCENPRDARCLIPQVLGRNPFDFVLDDAVWPLQEALYDIMAQALKVPIYKVLGHRYRDKVPVCYWSHHFSPEDLAKEALRAAEGGFRVHKFKVRPYFDPVAQVKAMAEAVPENSIVPDANATLESPSRAVQFARSVERYNIFCLESPIPQSDAEGYLTIKNRVDMPLAAHLADGEPNPNPILSLAKGLVDYYVLEEQGVWSTFKYAGAVEAWSGTRPDVWRGPWRPLWLEGYGRTAIAEAFQVHLSCVIKMATLPGTLFIQRLREHPLVEDPLQVKDGLVEVPEKPGLGVTLDERALKKYLVR